MAEPFLGEIRVFSFNFAPKGWAICNGQLLPINQNQGLFSLLGTSYGGDGRVTFALPDLRARMPMHQGIGYTQGQSGGEAAHTLTLAEMPAHTHALQATTATGQATSPAGTSNLPAASRGHYAQSGDATLHSSTLASVGGGQAHLNMPPFLVLNFCISLVGIFPSLN
ncbi:Phage Tail Collar Domain [Delftia tsuruhatensis]|uniref:phage tail protein n=1 Tax=Delftia tsuruhatensis TaxID=180282 RepID=UPI001E786186|nr:tail fiber protein [Delftia tsuruhatensis]CAB5660412.1 Phage Tail Collar Domain [Delftia tsuruhatensis]CAC9679867.1 Phage Tail Collar Domain [Delftia tsuruhatensis]